MPALESGAVVGPDNHDAWLEARRSTVGASEAHDCVHRPLELWLRKTGRLEPEAPNEMMRAGLLLEPAIAAAYEAEAGVPLLGRQTFVRHPEHPLITATLDGVRPDGTPVELKAVGRWASDRFGEPGTDQVPDRYLYQCQHQMLVTGAERVELYAFFGADLRFGRYEVRRSDRFLELLLGVEVEFLRRLADDDAPPPSGDEHPRVIEALHPNPSGWCLLGPEARAAADRYLGISATIAALNKDRDRARAELLAALGDCEGGELADGRTVRRAAVSVKEHTVKASKYFKLTITEPR
jgi:putative phage-type endonuclease